jgi:hypothetical protein
MNTFFLFVQITVYIRLCRRRRRFQKRRRNEKTRKTQRKENLTSPTSNGVTQTGVGPSVFEQISTRQNRKGNVFCGPKIAGKKRIQKRRNSRSFSWLL